MMKQIVYTNKLCFYGKMPEVLDQLKKLSADYKTVKQFIDTLRA